MPRKVTALQKRLAPFVPLTLELLDGDGGKVIHTLRLCWDFNAICEAEEATGMKVLDGEIFKNSISGKVLSAMLWAAALAYQPEYEGREGLGIIRSYMQASNATLIAEKLFEAYVITLPAEEQEMMRKAKEAAEKGEENPIPAATAKP